MLKFFWSIFKIFTFSLIIAFSLAVYLVYHYAKDLPDYSQLANYHPPLVTRIYSADGKLMEEYAKERRVFVPISSVPKSLIEAFIASEDKNFFSHPGLDIVGITRAAISNISYLKGGSRMAGGSTITQQVVKNFLLSPERSIERKIKEAILSYRISKVFTKEHILELYLNQIFLGKRSYGVAAAAQNYFNKSVEELNLVESAFLAGLPQAPSKFDPNKNYKKSKARRDYVILRMLEDGYITNAAAKEALDTPITIINRSPTETVNAQYYTETVRDEVIKMFGQEYFYTAGLTIITSLDTELQSFAETSFRHGLREYDRKRGYRGNITNIPLKNWQTALQELSPPHGILEYKLAVVLSVADKQVQIGLKDGSTSKIPLAEMNWAKTNLKSAKSLLNKGDVIVVEKTKNGYALRQIPSVNGAIMVMNPSTGQVLAQQGGYDFETNKYNRVTQAQRQPGSLSKSFVFLAGLENGLKPNTIFSDSPIAISQGKGMPLWKPKNYKGDYLGNITMRKGLEASRNLVTVRVAQSIGLYKVAEVVQRFGINKNPTKFYSMVLGAIETTLEKMTNAYAIIANQGKKVTPQYIELIKDRHGKILYRRDNRNCFLCTIPEERLGDGDILPVISERTEPQITDPAISYQITSMLQGAVERGTGQRAKILGKIIAGKTGTSNDSRDTWFIGFTPNIVVGTYVGYDAPKTLGKTSTGANVALPIFIKFMEQADKKIPSVQFKVPRNIELLSVDSHTGEKSQGPNTIQEAFRINNIEFKEAEEQNINTIINPAEEARDIFDNILEEHFEGEKDENVSYDIY